MARGLFVAPFVLLMPAENKRKPILAIVAGIALLGHWLTLLWVVLPVGHHLSVAATLLAAPGALAFVSGMSAYNVRRALADASPYPTQDPRLPEAVPAAVLETEGGH